MRDITMQYRWTNRNLTTLSLAHAIVNLQPREPYKIEEVLDLLYSAFALERSTLMVRYTLGLALSR